jgi:hypothetical protein
MLKPSLGRIEKIDPREYWKSESGEFTPWLALPENIALLGDSLGIELEIVATEKDVGPFRADILCKDTNSNYVLIENQLEPTDHTHLGQLITYASGLDAVTIVWIAKEMREEHRAALDWLNRITANNINFFGIEIILKQIGDSPLAPEFVVTSKPNDWTRTPPSGKFTELELLRFEYWTAFKNYVGDNKIVRCRKPREAPYMDFALGKSGFWFTAVITSSESQQKIAPPGIRVGFLFEGASSKIVFEQLFEQKTAIEKEIGILLEWKGPNNSSRCNIFAHKSARIEDTADWPNQHAWLKNMIGAFYRAFQHRIKALNLNENAE